MFLRARSGGKEASVSMKVKVYGAGSIGNHLSQAARQMGWSVAIVDIDPAALERMKSDIYPSRYGAWDESISLHELGQEPKGEFDMIFIGTPPDHHLDLALAAADEKPLALFVEKPVCTPNLDEIAGFNALLDRPGMATFVGYDHIVGKATKVVEQMLAEKAVGEIETLDVEFREHWRGIFAAHPWLSGPEDTYLGFWRRGGGAAGEHSHAVNLWQHFAHAIGAGYVSEVQAMLEFA